MEKKKHNIEDLPRDNRGSYRVPEGYFSELTHNIVEQTQRPAHGGVWATLRSMAAFAGSFAVLAILATIGYYFTGHQAQKAEIEDDSFYLMSLYHVTTEDIININAEETPESTTVFAEAALDYIAVYGYDLVEITEQ